MSKTIFLYMLSILLLLYINEISVCCVLKITVHSTSMEREVDQMKLKEILSATIISLCNNSLSYSGELTIQGLLGITIDHKDILLVNINETLGHAGSTSGGQQCQTVVHMQADDTETEFLQPLANEIHQNYNSDVGAVAVQQKRAVNTGKSTVTSKSRVSIRICNFNNLEIRGSLFFIKMTN